MLNKEYLYFLKKLISLPSYVDTKHNEKAVINYLFDLISKNTDFNITKQFVEKDRYNLIIRDNSPTKLVLFGHMDTVLPKHQTSKPFSPKIKNKKIYGLGSVDMKAGLAVALDILFNHHHLGIAYVFTVDEEYEFKGALKLKEIKDIKPDWIINLEPTDNQVLNGCRGITEFSFDVEGKSVHASRKNEGVNAIEKSVDTISLFQQKISQFDDKLSGLNTINLARLNGGMLQAYDKNNQPVLSGLGMVVPNFAHLNCEIRIASPKIDKKYIISTLKTIAKQKKIKLSNFNFKFYLNRLFTPPSQLASFEQSLKSCRLSKKYLDISSAGFYEVQLLQQAWGGKTVIFGPGPMSLAHMVDEYCDLATIQKTKQVILDFISKNF